MTYERRTRERLEELNFLQRISDSVTARKLNKYFCVFKYF